MSSIPSLGLRPALTSAVPPALDRFAGDIIFKFRFSNFDLLISIFHFLISDWTHAPTALDFNNMSKSSGWMAHNNASSFSMSPFRTMVTSDSSSVNEPFLFVSGIS